LVSNLARRGYLILVIAITATFLIVACESGGRADRGGSDGALKVVETTKVETKKVEAQRAEPEAIVESDSKQNVAVVEKQMVDSSSDKAIALFKDNACGACHVVKNVPGAIGVVGPALDGLSTRDTIAGGALTNTKANIIKWLTDPPGVKPGTLMPKLTLSSADMEILADWLVTLP
tara:strand:- start:3768 stop:4295 length:528 start_codon:yes stop_codon:yes gene_type:complete